MSETEHAKTIRICRIRDGWVVHPDEPYWGSKASWKSRADNKVEAFIRGSGWKTLKVLEERVVPALQKGYSLDELNEFVVRYGSTVTEACMNWVYPGAMVCQGTETSLAQSLHRPRGEDLERFRKTFGREWQRFLVGMSAMFGRPLFDIVAFDRWCVKEQGYVEDGKVSLTDFMKQKWGNDVYDWFRDRILNSEAAGA